MLVYSNSTSNSVGRVVLKDVLYQCEAGIFAYSYIAPPASLAELL